MCVFDLYDNCISAPSRVALHECRLREVAPAVRVPYGGSQFSRSFAPRGGHFFGEVSAIRIMSVVMLVVSMV